jgi:hypothetical protein
MTGFVFRFGLSYFGYIFIEARRFTKLSSPGKASSIFAAFSQLGDEI